MSSPCRRARVRKTCQPAPALAAAHIADCWNWPCGCDSRNSSHSGAATPEDSTSMGGSAANGAARNEPTGAPTSAEVKGENRFTGSQGLGGVRPQSGSPSMRGANARNPGSQTAGSPHGRVLCMAIRPQGSSGGSPANTPTSRRCCLGKHQLSTSLATGFTTRWAGRRTSRHPRSR